MIRRPTWIALFLLAVLAAFAVFLSRKEETPQAAQETPTPAEKALFANEKGRVTGLSILSAEGQTVEISRGVDGSWVLTQPEQVPADQGQAEAAAVQVGVIQSLGSVDAPLDAVGLDKPAYTIKVTIAGGVTHTLEIGDKTPTEAGYYARLDAGDVLILSEAGIASLLTLLSSPPYKETPTPSLVPPTAISALPAGSGTPAATPATPAP
jgi:hypothetical protein